MNYIFEGAYSDILIKYWHSVCHKMVQITHNIQLKNSASKYSSLFNIYKQCRSMTHPSIYFVSELCPCGQTEKLTEKTNSRLTACCIETQDENNEMITKHINLPHSKMMRTTFPKTPSLIMDGSGHTVYPKKYAHGFVVLCFVVVMQSFIMNSYEVFIHIHQGCFAGTGAIVRLPRCQWSKPDGYGKISQCITTTKHSKAKTVCIFLGIYCSCVWVVLSCSMSYG